MKSKLRIISFLICLMMIPQISFAVPDKLWADDGELDRIYGVNSTGDSNLKSDILQDLLRSLGIIDEELFDGTKKAVFHDYVKAIAVISGNFSESATDEELLESLYDSGYVNFQAKKNNIRFDELIYSAVSLTGYKKMAEYSGGFPTGYETLADDAGLMYGISYSRDQYITKGELAQVLYNILTVDTMEIKISNGETTFEVASVPTILERKFDVTLVKGILNRIDETSMYESGYLKKGYIEIDRVKYVYNGNKDYSELLGHCVNAFIYEADEDAELLCMDAKTGKNETVKFSGKETDKISDTEIKININGKSKRYGLKDDTRIIYNGIYAGNVLSGELEKYLEIDSDITAVDNDSDSKLDLFVIWDYEHFPVMYDVGENGKVRFKNGMTFRGEGYVIAKTEDDNSVTVVMNGEIVDYSSIKKNNIVSIAKSINTYGTVYTRIIVSDKTMNGVIKGIREDDWGTALFEIENENYEITEEYLDACGWPEGSVRDDVILPKMGLSAIYYMTFDGKIADIQSESGVLYGYFLKARVYDEEATDNPQVALKIFTTEGKMQEIYLEEKVDLYLNDVPPKGKTKRQDVPDMIKSLSTGNDIRTVIAYNINGRGNIKSLYLPYYNIGGSIGTLDYPLTYDYLGEGYTNSRYYHGMMATKYRMKNNMTLFLVPKFEDKDNDLLYKAVAPDFYGIDHTYYGIKLYGIDKYLTAAVGVVADDGVTFENSAPAIVDKVVATVNEDNELVYKIYYYMDSKYMSIDTSRGDMVSAKQDGWIQDITPDKLKFGDLIHFRSSNNKIDSFRVLLHDYDKTSCFIKEGTGKTLTTQTQPMGFVIFYGDVTAINDDVILLNTSERGSTVSAHKLSNPKVYLVEEKKIEPVTLSEIEVTDRVAMRKAYQGVLDIYIYR